MDTEQIPPLQEEPGSALSSCARQGLAAVPELVPVPREGCPSCARGSEPCQAPLGASSAWIPPALALGWALAVPSSSLGVTCPCPHFQLCQGCPRLCPCAGGSGVTQGMASRAGCSCCHLPELLRLMFLLEQQQKPCGALSMPGLCPCLGSVLWAGLGLSPGSEGASTSAGSAGHYFCPVFKHSPVAGRDQDPGEGNHPHLQVLLDPHLHLSLRGQAQGAAALVSFRASSKGGLC